ncbi:prephenate dehydrogenase [Metallumcola ferriviriculae]|uniref:Prephenate dehydrogenase n=1 Tax=Metallumcola ferriviriculae TaxID=3039180 RepID=A0AAU0UT05_9FIRM|nr:prephenate dehydrogenase [Desulfitibacteraceae bacterium MK1]
MTKFGRLVIVGLGLIGGSLAMAWKKAAVAEEIVGVDIDDAVCTMAETMGAVDWATREVAEAVSKAQVVVLAVPVAKIEQVAELVLKHIPRQCLITDVGSTKAGLTGRLSDIFAHRGTYIGGHPMAGSEQTGIAGADPYLFENAVYILTPRQENIPAVDQLALLVGKLGARSIIMPPGQHDAIVAAVSHLPHVVAAGLVNTASGVEERFPRTLMLAAGGFRDTTRIASGDPGLWQGICRANKEQLLQVLKEFQHNITHFIHLLAADDTDGIKGYLTRARITRESIPAKRRGFLPQVFDLVVTVPDRPGMIGSLAQLLGGHGVNIADIEILRAREGDGGTIRLGVQSAEALDRAVELLAGAGYPVRKL